MQEGTHRAVGGQAMLRQHQVLADAEVLHQPNLLERATDAETGSRAGTEDGDVAAVEEHLSCAGSDEARYSVEERGLAGAVGADEAGDDTGLHRQTHVVDGGQAAKAHRELANLEGRPRMRRRGGRGPR